MGATGRAIMRAIQDNPHITIAELAQNLNRSTSAMEKQIAKLQETRHIRRVGPDHGGQWEVIQNG